MLNSTCFTYLCTHQWSLGSRYCRFQAMGQGVYLDPHCSGWYRRGKLYNIRCENIVYKVHRLGCFDCALPLPICLAKYDELNSESLLGPQVFEKSIDGFIEFIDRTDLDSCAEQVIPGGTGLIACSNISITYKPMVLRTFSKMIALLTELMNRDRLGAQGAIKELVGDCNSKMYSSGYVRTA